MFFFSHVFDFIHLSSLLSLHSLHLKMLFLMSMKHQFVRRIGTHHGVSLHGETIISVATI